MQPQRVKNKTIPAIFLSVIHRIEDGILVMLLACMIGLAGYQILLRNWFDSGIVWADMLLRVLVLWVGLFGAIVASREDKHIRIDLITRYLPHRAKMITEGIASLFSAGVCALVTYHSFRFVRMEYDFGSHAFSSVPAWICEAVIPVAFAIIGLRFLIQFGLTLKQLFGHPS